MNLDLSGLEKLTARVRRIADFDATPLMMTWMDTIQEDNRRGVLAGLDKDGNPLAPVTYRPMGPAKKLTAAQRNGANARKRFGSFMGHGPAAAGLHNNLTSAEYRTLGGPPLAPRGQFSRVVTNLKTSYAPPEGGNGWTAIGIWKGVVSTRGVPFLPFHFRGDGRLPKRDLRGVRPWGMERAKNAARAWMVDLVRTHG